MFDSLSRDVSTPEKLVAYVVNEGCPDRLHGVPVDYAARVTAGVTLLDSKIPGWWKTDHECPIDLDVLDVANGKYCVSAQLSGSRNFYTSFVDGRIALGLTDSNDGTYTTHGFSAESSSYMTDIHGDRLPHIDEDYDDDEAFVLLTTLWANIIRVRRGLPVDLTI
jgi:hypothetical protein